MANLSEYRRFVVCESAALHARIVHSFRVRMPVDSQMLVNHFAGKGFYTYVEDPSVGLFAIGNKGRSW